MSDGSPALIERLPRTRVAQNDLQEHATRLAEDARQFAKENPVKTAALLFGTSFLAGRILRKLPLGRIVSVLPLLIKAKRSAQG